MLGPSRPIPKIGASARIAHFGGTFEMSTIVSVLEDGRRVCVKCADGGLEEFVLHPATAQFVSAADAHGSRLELTR